MGIRDPGKGRRRTTGRTGGGNVRHRVRVFVRANTPTESVHSERGGCPFRQDLLTAWVVDEVIVNRPSSRNNVPNASIRELLGSTLPTEGPRDSRLNEAVCQLAAGVADRRYVYPKSGIRQAGHLAMTSEGIVEFDPTH